MTFETWKPLAAALEFDGDNVEIAVIMRASGLWVDSDTIYNFVMN